MKFQVQELRPEVLAFALLMEERLRDKDAEKGSTWKAISEHNMMVHATSKAIRLEAEVADDDLLEPERIKHAVDLANYCMMIADVAGALELAQEQPEKKYNGVNPNFYDLVEHLERQQDFSLRTFGPGMRTAGLIDHIQKELTEIKANPIDVTEWVDVVLLGLDGAWRAGYVPEEICQAIHAKLQRNIERAWPDWRTVEPGKAIEHIRGEA